MAMVGNQPFLYWLLRYLEQQNFTNIVLSLGHLSEAIVTYCEAEFSRMPIKFNIETSPLGTGGAIMQAMDKIAGQSFFVMNGDTLFNIDTEGLAMNARAWNTDISVALKPMENFERYGAVELSSVQRIKAFHEKKLTENGLINGGIYQLEKSVFEGFEDQPVFSFEKDILEKKLNDYKIHGFEYNAYFIDIGVPTDYEKAQAEVPLLF
jgi:D-glycero-alpha-D-manno-heptose 1-phosphate guanylyltransferase